LLRLHYDYRLNCNTLILNYIKLLIKFNTKGNKNITI